MSTTVIKADAEAAVTAMTPAAWLGATPRDQKEWRRTVRAAGVRLNLCPLCGFPGTVAARCPVCVGPPEASRG